MPAKQVYNPPAAQLAVWKAYLDKNGGHIRKAHLQLPEPKPSYIAFMKICNKNFGLSPLQAARQKHKSQQRVDEPVVVKKELETVRPFRSAPAVSINGVKQSNASDKIVEIIWSAIKSNNMNGEEFKGFVKGLLTGFELK